MEVFRDTTPGAYRDIVNMLDGMESQDSRVGDTKEVRMVAVESHDPRERWMWRPEINWAFGLQECFAYWNGENPGLVQRYNTRMKEFMYEGKLHGSAYGRYLRDIPHDQVQRVIDQLRDSPETRRAVINIHHAGVEDYDKGDVACTIYLQLFIRDGELHMTANLRSQDMLWGYPYDTQAFQWIQEVMAGILEVDVGTYTHIMNSCHYYTDFEDRVLDKTFNVRRLPDCRLDELSVERVMETLDVALARARLGDVPRKEIIHLDKLSQFYGDWARMMTVYEHDRFHGEHVVDLYDELKVSAFRKYLKKR